MRSAYLVTGSEPLLIAEAATAIRQAARAAGYADREVHFIERGFDWTSCCVIRPTCRCSRRGD